MSEPQRTERRPTLDSPPSQVQLSPTIVAAADHGSRTRRAAVILFLTILYEKLTHIVKK